MELIKEVLDSARLKDDQFNFADRSQVSELRTMLQRELEAQGGLLTRSESAVLQEKLRQMRMAPNVEEAKVAFNGFKGTLSTMSGNSFKVETLAHKDGDPAGAEVEQGLRNDLTRLKARVDYLSRFGGDNGEALLKEKDATLLRGYLDRAEGRLQFYAKPVGGVGVGLTKGEAEEVRKALTGTPETGDPAPAPGAKSAVELIKEVLDSARLVGKLV